MIDYLKQLELDLVDAIDREQAARVRHRRPRRPHERPEWRPVATVAAILLAIVVVIALVGTSPDRERTVGPAPGPIVLQLNGTFSRIDTATWQGSARGPDGTGILTMTAADGLGALDAGNRIPFGWTTTGGSITRCITGAMQRPHAGRVAWSAQGVVTAATGALRGYRGRDVRITASTRVSTPDPNAPGIARTKRQPSRPGGRLSVLPDPASC